MLRTRRLLRCALESSRLGAKLRECLDHDTLEKLTHCFDVKTEAAVLLFLLLLLLLVSLVCVFTFRFTRTCCFEIKAV